MEIDKDARGRLTTSDDGVVLPKWLAALAATALVFMVAEFAAGRAGSERFIGLIGATCTFALGALVSYERSRFVFDAKRRTIEWRRRWGFRERSGVAAFDDVVAVSIERTLGDEGIPSRRILLLLRDRSAIPLTVGYRTDADDRILKLASEFRDYLGLRESAGPRDDARDLARGGSKLAAIRLLVESEGLSLRDAKARVDAFRSEAPIGGGA
jgi:hypothetical protein